MGERLTKDLPIKTLGDLAVKRGLSSYYSKGGGDVTVPVINIKDIQGGKIDAETVDRVSVRKTDLLEKSRIAPGDVIITIKGLGFRAAVADESLAGFAISANLAAVTPSHEIKPEVLAAYLNSPAGQRELLLRAGMGAIRGLNLKSLSEVPIPSIERQETLSRFLSLAQEYEEILKKELDLRAKVKDGIVSQVMVGSLRKS